MFIKLGKLQSYKFGSILAKTQKTILSAAVILAVSSGATALLGVLKNRLLAKYFGISKDLTIFYTADRVPNMIYSILVVGAVSTIFIPIFTNALKKSKEEAFETASSIINATFSFFLGLGLLVYFFAPFIIRVVSVDTFDAEEIRTGANLMRLMLASQVLLVAGSLATSLLHSFNYFIIPALAPVFYNVGMIAGIILLSEKFGIYGPAIGVLIGSLLHFAIQIPLVQKTGYKYSASLKFKNKDLRDLISLVPARIGSVLIANIIQIVSNSLAILASEASVVFLKFANQLQNFPVTLVGYSMAAASLPTLSMQGDLEDKGSFKETFLTSFHQTMFMVLPISMIMFILRVPAVRIVYGVKGFPWEATLETSRTLAFFSVSIFAQSANYLLTRSFFAIKNTKIPVIVSFCTGVINIVLSILFITHLKLGVWSLALTYSITSVMDTLILFYLLDRELGGFRRKAILKPFFKISLSTLLMGITLYIPMKLLDSYILDTSKTINLLILTVIAGICGTVTYVLFTKLFKVREVQLLHTLARKIKPGEEALEPQNLRYGDNI